MKNFINTLVNSGNVTLVAGFDGAPVPPIRRPWGVGCRITVPKDYQVCMQEMPTGNKLFFVPVLVTFPDGDEFVDKFFTSTLFKSVITTDNQYLRTRGSVVDKARQYSNLDDAFCYGLAGRTFEITVDILCEVRDLRNDVYRNTHIYQFDFVYSRAV